jgi:hypothetical protein
LIEVVEDAVKVALVLDNFPNVGDFLNLVVIHEGDVFVLEDLLPGGLLVQLLDSRQFASLCVFGAEEGVPFSLYYLVEEAVLLHAINFINILSRVQPKLHIEWANQIGKLFKNQGCDSNYLSWNEIYKVLRTSTMNKQSEIITVALGCSYWLVAS